MASNNGVPAFLAEHGLTQYMQAGKDQGAKVLMRPCYPLKVNLYGFFLLHGPAYQSEKAVKMVAGERVPIASADIVREIHAAATAYYKSAGIVDSPSPSPQNPRQTVFDTLKPSRQNLRRALAELEEDGSIERRRAPDGKPLRELSETEAKKLSGNKIEYYFWVCPRKPSEESVRRNYEQRIAESKAPEVVTDGLPSMSHEIAHIFSVFKAFGLKEIPGFDPASLEDENCLKKASQTIETAHSIIVDGFAHLSDEELDRSIRGYIAFLGLQSSPGFRPQDLADPRRYTVVKTAYLAACASFTKTIKDVHPEAFEQSPAVPAAENPEKEPSPIDLSIQSNAMVEPGSDNLAKLRAGLVSRGFSTLDDDSIRKIVDALGDTPLERFWITLDDRLRRGRISFKFVLEKASAARSNYVAALESMQQTERQQAEQQTRRRAEQIEMAQKIMAEQNKPGMTELELQWAKEILSEAS